MVAGTPPFAGCDEWFPVRVPSQDPRRLRNYRDSGELRCFLSHCRLRLQSPARGARRGPRSFRPRRDSGVGAQLQRGRRCRQCESLQGAARRNTMCLPFIPARERDPAAFGVNREEVAGLTAECDRVPPRVVCQSKVKVAASRYFPPARGRISGSGSEISALRGERETGDGRSLMQYAHLPTPRDVPDTCGVILIRGCKVFPIGTEFQRVDTPLLSKFVIEPSASALTCTDRAEV
jgi:hypothetical protein